MIKNEGDRIPSVNFIFREDGKFVTRSSDELFANKRVVIFSLPGAFTPTCSAYQLPGFEEKYKLFLESTVNEIYCISVNDCFVMNAWQKDQNIQNVKLIADGNAEFTRAMGMLVNKENFGFGQRSWRYAALVDNCIIKNLFVEEGLGDNVETDPYIETTPEKVLEKIQSAISFEYLKLILKEPA